MVLILTDTGFHPVKKPPAETGGFGMQEMD